MSALQTDTAEDDARLGAKVSVADALLGFEQRGGFADGFHGRNTPAEPPGHCRLASLQGQPHLSSATFRTFYHAHMPLVLAYF